jgi:glycosyltransferase involved in cell wall biosynthesis
MYCPSIAELPLIPPGKTGWPWDFAPASLPRFMGDGGPWPRITIVTPSFNQAVFIEETIRSVLLQGYPNLEYMIIDGGSTDDSMEIIRKYSPWLSYWVSEPDRGQSHAINKGFALATGEIMAWINSDDFYCPGIFQKIAEFFSREGFNWVAGKCMMIGIDGISMEHGFRPPSTIHTWLIHNLVPQPAVFWKAKLWNSDTCLDENLHYCLDYELWLQFLSRGHAPGWINQPLANFRLHPQSKSVKDKMKWGKEGEIVFKRYYPGLRRIEKIKYHIQYKLTMFNELMEMKDKKAHHLLSFFRH